MRKNGGITLIALVVTIIILIILAGVSINVLIGDNGIITKAKEAKKTQDVARILEKLELEKLDLGMSNEYKAQLDAYLEHLKNKGIIEESDIKDAWNTGLGKCHIVVEDKYTFLLEQEGDNIKITFIDGPVILNLETQVDPELGTITVNVVTTNVTDGTYEYSIRTLDGGYTIEKTSGEAEYTYEGLTKDTQYYIKVVVVDDKGIDEEEKAVYTSVIQPGSYVNYELIAKTFTMTAAQTGHETDQTFNTNDYQGLWRVLYNDTEHGLQIISADSVANLYLSGDVGYNNLVETLNAFSSNYEDETLAESSRIVGTDPTNSVDQATGNVQFVVEFNGSKDSGLKTPDTTYLSDYEAMSVQGIHDIGGYYWLGSRKVYSDSEVGYFSIYTLANGGNVEYRRMIDMYANIETNNVFKYEYSYGVRPVIKFAIASTGITSGTGTAGDPFVLGAK